MVKDIPSAARNRVNQLARQRAGTILRRRHHDEWLDLLHEQKHRLGMAHHHSAAHPETIQWWGETRSA